MEIKIYFRGVMLFATDLGAVREVALPQTWTKKRNGEDDHHPDGAERIQHYRGLLHASAAETRYELGNGIFAWSTGTTRLGQSALRGLPSVKKPKGNKSELLYTPKVKSTRLELTFPKKPVRARAEYQPEVRFSFYQDGPALAHGLELTFDTEFSLKAQDGRSIDLKLGDRLYVYNSDDEKPTEESLNKAYAYDPKEPEDHDFKWLYELVRPSRGTMGNWIESWLPAPTARPEPRKEIPSVSTCFPGWI